MTDRGREIVRTRFKEPWSGRRQKKWDLTIWRRDVERRDGRRCVACKVRTATLAAHHLIFRSHCAPRYVTDVRNGMMLCSDFGQGCHEKLHAGKLKIRFEWLRKEQVACMAEQGLTWNDEGKPQGTLAVYFAPRKLTNPESRS